MNCPHCGAPIEDHFKFCPECAKPILENQSVVLVCRTCGGLLDFKTLKCPSCEPQAFASAAQPIPQQPEQPASQPQVQQPASQPQYRQPEPQPEPQPQYRFAAPQPQVRQPEPQPEQKKPRKKTGLIIGIVVGLLVVLGVLAGVFLPKLLNGGAETDNGSTDPANNGAAASDATPRIAVVTDVGQLMDKGFNQGTYEGAVAYGNAHGIGVKYYQPANGADASDNDRIDAMKQAINNGAEIIVAPGFLQATAMETVARENPAVKFVFVDGWALGLDNVTAIVYKEQESGYLAGYAAVMEGYTKLGFTGGGGGVNPAVNRFGYGFIQGAEAAAAEKGVRVEMKYSFKYGETFSASTELQTQIAGWYNSGTEVVFSCGGSMFQSVKSAAGEYPAAKIIGVDVDQSGESEKVITSAVKGLAASVEKVLGQYFDGKWDAELKNVAQNLGASDDATGLPTDTWRLQNFTVAQYNELYEKIKNGVIVPRDDEPADVTAGWSYVTVDFEQ